jgi:signal transduction histidine kinase
MTSPIERSSPWYRWREPQVLREQVALMQRNFKITLVASLATALGAVWVLSALMASRTVMWLWLWLAAHLLVISVVYISVYGKLTDVRTPQRRARILVMCMGAMGLSWGSLAWLTARHGSLEALLFATTIIGGVSSGALGLGAALLPAYMAYLVFPVVFVGLAFSLIGGQTFLAMVGMALVYFVLTCLQARNAEEATYSGILLQIENSALVQRLRLESTHAQLALQSAETAQAQAEQANADKSKFLAAASHDLRQPLHAMGLFLEALSRSTMNKDQLTMLEHAHSASSAASEMLTTLLDFSRLEAGVVKSQPKPILIQPLLMKLEQEFGLQADAKNLVFRSRDTTLAALADPNLTDLVLRNFISNAIRYTDQGGVLVGCRARGEHVVIEVWDTGIGIPSNQQSDIFKEFHQLGNPERDRRKGLGLGLAIVERISDAMQARVTLRSAPGRGSVFRLWLTGYRGVIVEDREDTTASKDLHGLRVLVIDDEEPVRAGMQELLSSWGCICHIADDMSSALNCVALLPMHEQPQVILADYRLREGATGGQAISALRAYLLLRGYDAAVPAIIITGDTAPERLREAQSTDAQLLHKPVSVTELAQALQRVIA